MAAVYALNFCSREQEEHRAGERPAKIFGAVIINEKQQSNYQPYLTLTISAINVYNKVTIKTVFSNYTTTPRLSEDM
jgi:hypothetical protein